MACHYVATSGCDGTLFPSDACVALRLAAADVSGDRQVTALDVLMILQAAVENVEL